MSQNFIEAIKSGYALKGEQAKIGIARLGGKVVPGAPGSRNLQAADSAGEAGEARSAKPGKQPKEASFFRW
jgi:hypothetical protein